MSGSAVGRGARLRRQRLVPPDEVEQRVGRHRRRRVDGAAAGEGVVGHRLRRPVARRRRGEWAACQARKASSSPLSPGLGRIGVVALAAVVAVEQAGSDAATVGVHRTERRDHRRHVDGGDVEALAHLRERGHDAVPPGLVDVVLELARHPAVHLVRHAGAGDDVAVRVGGHRLHRGRADVDAQGHARRRPRS